MNTTYLFYKGVQLFIVYNEILGEDPEIETGFKGTENWKEIQGIFVNGVDITHLLEAEFDAIEQQLNN